MNRLAALALACLSLPLAACGNVPLPDYFYDRYPDGKPVPNKDTSGYVPSRTQLKLDDLTDHIECELRNAPNLDALLKTAANGDAAQPYVVEITLTLKMDDNAGLTPSLSYIYPLANMTSLTVGMNANANVDRARTFTTSYFIALDQLRKDPRIKALCIPDDKKADGGPVPSLFGTLGIDGIIAAGLAGRGDEYAPTRSANYIAPPAPSGHDTAATPRDPNAKVPSVYPTFGETVQFTILATGDVGPTWSLKDFKGPNGSKGILNGGATMTDSVIFAFSPSALTPKTVDLIKQRDAVKGASAQLDADVHAGKLSPESVGVMRLNYEKRIQLLDTQIGAETARVAPSRGKSDSDAAGAAQTFTTNTILQNLAGTLQSH